MYNQSIATYLWIRQYNVLCIISSIHVKCIYVRLQTTMTAKTYGCQVDMKDIKQDHKAQKNLTPCVRLLLQPISVYYPNRTLKQPSEKITQMCTSCKVISDMSTDVQKVKLLSFVTQGFHEPGIPNPTTKDN